MAMQPRNHDSTIVNKIIFFKPANTLIIRPDMKMSSGGYPLA